MLKSISLQNYKSFGTRQNVDLGPITVLVGPNNSGKSAFMSVGRFVEKAANAHLKFGEVIASEGGVKALVHRPPTTPTDLALSWSTTEGSYDTRLALREGELVAVMEELMLGETPAWVTTEKHREFEGGSRIGVNQPFGGLREVTLDPSLGRFGVVTRPLVSSRLVKLSPDRLREDAPPTKSFQLTSDGSGLAQVVARWREGFPKRAAQLDEFVAKCVPEIEYVLAEPVLGDRSVPGTKRLAVQQRDGQQFGAPQLSDGLLSFIALAMHAIDVGEGSVLFVEEPEQSIHPTRLHELIDLFRTIAFDRKCQIVIATHSTLVLNEFRDEPEHVKLFRRSDTGTRVRSLSEFPSLLDDLDEADLGSLFAAGLFDKAFSQLESQSSDEP